MCDPAFLICTVFLSLAVVICNAKYYIQAMMYSLLHMKMLFVFFAMFYQIKILKNGRVHSKLKQFSKKSRGRS
jgi:hypothetical protein